MGCEASRCNETSTSKGISIVIPSLEGWPTKAKEEPSPHEVRLSPLDTNPVFECLEDKRHLLNHVKHFVSLFLLCIFYFVEQIKKMTCRMKEKI